MLLTASPNTSTPILPPLPRWTDAASVASYLASVFGLLVALVGIFHWGVPDSTLITALLPSLGAVIAGVAQIVNGIWHRKAAIAIARAFADSQSLTGHAWGSPITGTLEQTSIGWGELAKVIQEGIAEIKALITEVLNFLKGAK